MKGRKITSLPPIVGALGAFEMLKDSALGKDVSNRPTALTDKVGDITIDTCAPADTDVWETGIKRESVEGKWVIVSQYETAEQARRGHKGWLKLVTDDPACELKDIDMWNLNEQ